MSWYHLPYLSVLRSQTFALRSWTPLTMAVLQFFFRIPDVVPNVDWTPSPEHVCGMARCAGRLSSTWKHEWQLAYVEELERNLEMP
eukprot:292-Pelagomonas_calceolata.AAC.1